MTIGKQMRNTREAWFRRVGPHRFDAIHWKGAAVGYVGFGTFLLSFSTVACFGKGHPQLTGICITLCFGAVVGIIVAIALRGER